nr:CASP8-associated protein 2-like [Nerophis lumbriciformis]
MECSSNEMAHSGALHVNEDSVDIYDDLDLKAVSSSDKTPPSPSRLKESMDLYEEIVTEEQQGRESSFTDLKSRFQAAQNQIKELRRRLDQMEIQNTGLNTENHRLKKNISALLRTARQEVMRKDTEIQRLNQLSGKGHSFHHSKMYTQNASCQTDSSMDKPPISSLPTPSSVLCSLPQTSSSRDDRPPKVHLEPPRKENDSSNKTSGSCTETRVSSHSHSKGSSGRHDDQSDLSINNSVSSSSRRHGSDKYKSVHREEKCQKLLNSTDKNHYRTGLDSNTNNYTLEKVRSHKLDRERRHDSRTCKSGDHHGHRRSESAKALNVLGSSVDSKGRTREKKHRTSHSYTEDHSRHGRKNKISDEISSLEMELQNSESKDQKRSSINQHIECCSDSSKEKQRNRHSSDYQGREGKQREEEKDKSHKRNTASATRREGEKQPSGESCSNKHDVYNKEKQGKKHLPTSTKEPTEDKSENKKLCFMETLHLTLSPNKKLVRNSNGGHAALHLILEKGPDGGLQPDMYVVDEINCSELEASLEEPPTDSFKAPISKMHMKRDVQKDVQEKDTRIGVQQPEDTISCMLSQDSAGDHVALCVTPKAQENIFLVKEDGAKSKFSPDCQLDISKQRTATDGVVNVFGSVHGEEPRSHLQKTDNENTNEQCITVTQHADSRLVKDSTCVGKVMEYEGTCKTISTPEVLIQTIPGSRQTSLLTKPQDAKTLVQPPVSSGPANNKDTCLVQEDVKDANDVSSTISLESVPQEGLSLPEAIHVLTNKDDTGSSSITADQSSSLGCIGVPNVSSTTEEITLPDEYCDLTVTPKKNLCDKSHVEPSCSMPLLHDEDSMMRTLSNLQRIPDAISPLRSPIRMMKRSHLLVHERPGHVKSLQREFSSTSCDANSKKLDLNKENKYPGYPSKTSKQDLAVKLSELPSNLSDTELEEGEILSESDEASSGPPLNGTKRVKSRGTVRSKPSPKSRSKKKSEERTATENISKQQSPGNKSRFKTVCPLSTKASFLTIEEVMETFKLVRVEIRKKYMKLHKTFPKKSFCGVMENFRESFVQFVEGADFGQICCQAMELKSKLKVIIISMFNTIADNGIVKRIFDQQAVDLKQKLWDFVDGQLDYLLKDIYVTMKNMCRAVRTFPEEKKSCGTKKVSGLPHLKNQSRQMDQLKSCVAAYKTGLGSRGKDIRIIHTEKQRNVGTCPQNDVKADPGIDCPSPKKPSISEKNKLALVVSQSTSLLDKTDFELLTEQQASSLTFNLVRDSQMGEIFKCLLQGSDLLEPSGNTGDSTSWSLGTPKKNGETLISITTPSKFDSPPKFFTPTKFDTPSKLIATWSSISPRITSPQSKDQVRTNPALFDESCLLEVPSGNQVTLQSNLLSQRNYSILAEDLEVSLTNPSPLKSDSHLSFLQPSGMHAVSTPDSVISAHISEDALLDGEDATEQDIHLALDTDNSSIGSSSSLPSHIATNTFVLKPELPIQALVMEKSNDHFIVKIRQGATQTLNADDTSSQTQTEEHPNEDVAALESKSSYLLDKSQKDADPCNETPENLAIGLHTTGGGICSTADPFRPDKDPSHMSGTSKCVTNESQKVVASLRALSKMINSKEAFETSCNLSFEPNSQAFTVDVTVLNEGNPSPTLNMDNHSPSPIVSSSQKTPSPIKSIMSSHRESSETNEGSQVLSCLSDLQSKIKLPMSDKRLTVAEDLHRDTEECNKDVKKRTKRKKRQEHLKAKRPREEEEDQKEDVNSCSKNDDVDLKPLASSPSSVSAMNLIKKKGAVVIAWTRDEDRAILIDLKTKGASRETFADLSDKLKKPSEQIAQRFYQLMKLFKKQGKMDI